MAHKTRGTLFIEEVTERYEFEPHEMALVREIAATLDTIERLESLYESDLTSTGSMKQTILQPAISEARQQRLMLAKLFAALNLPAEEEGEVRRYGTAPVVVQAAR